MRNFWVLLALGSILLVGKLEWAEARSSSVNAIGAPPKSGVDGSVLATLRVGDTLFVGGFLGSVGQPRGTLITVDPASGSPDENSPAVAGLVNCAVSDGKGGWYVGGKVVAAGGVRRFGLARILADGRPGSWSPVVSGEVSCMATDGTRLFVGGGFTSIDGEPRQNLAAFDMATGSLLPWHPDPDDGVLALHVNAGRLYLGGFFSSVAGVPRSRVAAWDLLRDSLSSWAPEATGDVRCIETSDSTVYLGGRFYGVGGQPRALLAAVSATDGRVLEWAPAVSRANGIFYHDSGPRVSAIVVHHGAVYIGGSFDLVNGVERVCLAKLDQRTGELAAWDARSFWPLFGDLPPVTCLRVHGERLFVGGEFTQLGGRDFGQRNGDRTGFAAALDLETGDADEWDPRLTNCAFAIEFGTRGVLIGGYSVFAWDWVWRRGLMAVDLRTGLVTDWDVQMDGGVYALAAKSGTLYVGGDFTRASGESRQFLAAYDLTTGLLKPWNPSPDGLVRCIVAEDSIVRVGGGFSTIANTARSYAAGLDPATGELLPWDPAPNYHVSSIISGDSLVYLAGGFTHLHDQLALGLGVVGARFGEPKEFGSGLRGFFGKLALLDSTLYVAGHFEGVAGDPRVGLGAVDARTGRLLPWRADLGRSDTDNIYSNDISATREAIYVVGPFTSVAGRHKPYAVALDPSTAEILDWDPAPDEALFTVLSTGDMVLLGGILTAAEGRPTGGFAVVPAYGRPPTPASYPSAGLVLRQNSPNPAFDLTAVRFSSPVVGPARVELFDLQGRVVDSHSMTLAGNTGEHQAFLRVRGLNPGCYVYRVTVGGESAAKRMLVIR